MGFQFNTMKFMYFAAAAIFVTSVKGLSDDDAFDSSRGTVILDHDTIIAPLNVFTKSGGFEDGNTLMRNGGIDSVSFIKFKTICPVTVDSVRLLAKADDTTLGPRRAMKGFKLQADVDGDGNAEAIVVDEDITPTYFYLDEMYMFTEPIRAQVWRMEVIQGTSVQPYEGVRIRELDGFASHPFCTSTAALSATVDGLEVSKPQFLRSFQAKSDVISKKFAEGDIDAVKGVLCSLENHTKAQSGKKLTEASANDVLDCICEFRFMSGLSADCDTEG